MGKITLVMFTFSGIPAGNSAYSREFLLALTVTIVVGWSV